MDKAGMNAIHRARMLRLTQSGTLAALALLSQSAVGLAQSTGTLPARMTAITQRADSVRRETEVMIIRLTPRIDSLSKRLNELPIGSAEYFATDDSLLTAIRSLPRPTTFAGAGGTLSIQLAPSRVALRSSVFDVIPQGWFGFLADGVNRSWNEPTGSYVQYFEYPTVVAIETNSPASRAGVKSGDSLLAYDGVDLRGTAINITRLLTPGREVSVKLRRDGEAKDVVIAVEKAPANVMSERRSAAAVGRMETETRATLAVDSIERRTVEARVAGAYAAVGARGGTIVSPAPTPRAAAGGFGGSGRLVATRMPSGILGAAMKDVDEDFAKSIVGMKGRRGVFVTNVPFGSPAEKTGLKFGDVILRVESSDVTNVAHLRVRLMHAESNGVEKIRLLILRAGKTQELTLGSNR